MHNPHWAHGCLWIQETEDEEDYYYVYQNVGSKNVLIETYYLGEEDTVISYIKSWYGRRIREHNKRIQD